MSKVLLPMVAAFVMTLSACGGGGSSSSSGSTSGTTDTSDSGGSTPTATNSDGETISAVNVGIEIPSEISAVPADSSNGSAQASFLSFASALRKMSVTATSELATDSDYAKAIPSVYVEERALEQFDVIESVFSALAQTRYSDSENVNQGAYQAMIAWEEDQNGKDVKQLQTWTVDSRMIVVDIPADVTGNTTGDVNKLMAWIPERDHHSGEEELIKAEFIIYSAPAKGADGSLLNYGEWDMNVLMGANAAGVDTIPAEGPEAFFAASARVGSDGTSILKVHDKFTEEMDAAGAATTLSEEMKGILVRNGTNGYGQVSYPDWETCFRGGDPNESNSNPCANGVPINVAKYAYNANYLGVQETVNNTASPAVYKDRNLDGAIRVVHRYSLFHADENSAAGIAAGDDVEKHLNFGFPVTFESTAQGDSNISFNAFAYYGAWQGRHQLWGPGGVTATTDGSDGTTLTRQDVGPNETAPTYKLKEFNATFTKRSMVDANLADIENIAVETWLNDHYDMFYMSDPDNNPGTSDADWQYCSAGYIDWGQNNPVCRNKADNSDAGFTPLTGSSLLASLSVGSGERRQVNIHVCNQNGCSDYVYLATDPGEGFNFSGGAGFYEASWGQNGLSATSPAAKLTPTDGMNMSVNIGGSIYVAYTGEFSGPTTTTGWVTKTLESFDQATWTPTFTSGGDAEFTPSRGVEYYMNAKGQNYVVKRIADATGSAAAYSVQLELQTAANPANTDATKSILPTGTSYLAAPWNTDVKLTLVKDPADSNYLLLEVVSDSTGTYQAGALYTDDLWGLTAYNSSNQPLDASGATLVVDEWGWIDPSANNNRQPVQFNYEYAGDDGESWGKQQFLVDANNISSYIILSDPISLSGVTLYDNLGNDSGETVNLQFDGWMHGLPDMYFELQKNNWSISGLGDKVRRLKEGQEVTATDSTRYFVKPMETSLFLGEVNSFPNGDGQPDISAADAVDLTSVPNYTHHEMGVAPTTNAAGEPIVVKYSEGQPIQ